MAVSIDAMYVKNRRMNAWHVEELEGEDEFPPCDQLGFVLVAFAAEGVRSGIAIPHMEFESDLFCEGACVFQLPGTVALACSVMCTSTCVTTGAYQ